MRAGGVFGSVTSGSAFTTLAATAAAASARSASTETVGARLRASRRSDVSASSAGRAGEDAARRRSAFGVEKRLSPPRRRASGVPKSPPGLGPPGDAAAGAGAAGGAGGAGIASCFGGATGAGCDTDAPAAGMLARRLCIVIFCGALAFGTTRATLLTTGFVSGRLVRNLAGAGAIPAGVAPIFPLRHPAGPEHVHLGPQLTRSSRQTQ